MISHILRPLIPILLRNGIAYDRFEEIVRKAYVDEAIAKAQRDNHDATISSVSAVTGISRKKIKRLSKNQLIDIKDPKQQYNRASCIITAWLSDPRFSYANGQPRVLSIDSSENSFTNLVNYYGGDITPRDMLRLMLSLSFVEINSGLVHLLQYAYQPPRDPEHPIPAKNTSQLFKTIDHYHNIIDASQWFQRRERNPGLDEDRLAEYREYLLRQSHALLEETELN